MKLLVCLIVNDLRLNKVFIKSKLLFFSFFDNILQEYGEAMNKKIKQIYLYIIILLMCILSACTNQNTFVRIEYEGSLEINVGTSIQLDYVTSLNLRNDEPVWKSSNSSIIIDDGGLMFAKDVGVSTITISIKNYSNSITFTVIDENSFTLNVTKSEIIVGEQTQLFCTNVINDIKPIYEIISGSEFVTIEDNILYGIKAGTVSIVAYIGEQKSNVVTIKVNNKKLESISLSATSYYLYLDESADLIYSLSPIDSEYNIEYEIISGNEFIKIVDNEVTAIKADGVVVIIAKSDDIISNEIIIYTLNKIVSPDSIELSVDKTTCDVGDFVAINFKVTPINASKKIEFIFIYGEDNCYIVENRLYVTNKGTICFYGKIDDTVSNDIIINKVITEYDPYVNVSKYDFYSNYTEAVDYMDAYYRSIHGLMSGSIEKQDQAPTISSYQPTSNGKYLKNSALEYGDDGNTYYVLDSYGNHINTIYKDGAYVTLEEVAAYIFAFGDVPVNYTSKKSANPASSEWGEYLRVNHSYFSGDTSRYPYEPILPDINGCGGKLSYYELDIGTTGTDCDPKYDATIYNNGHTITRGAARIVYAKYDDYGDPITDINNKYVFYTYNHYNDFQEYLNYEGGWGEMFGNITGGGSISSKYDYNPTDYVTVILSNFKEYKINKNIILIPITLLKKEFSETYQFVY